MKDDTKLNPTVSTSDGSRFASTPPTPETLMNSLSGPASTPASRAVLSRFSVSLPEESLVIDDRSHLSPAQIVESRLMNRLKESSLPVSHIQMRGLVRNRYQA